MFFCLFSLTSPVQTPFMIFIVPMLALFSQSREQLTLIPSPSNEKRPGTTKRQMSFYSACHSNFIFAQGIDKPPSYLVYSTHEYD
jgi:hypothetical protein